MEKEARHLGLKNLLAVVSADNEPSIKLLEKNAYNKCAHFKNVGEKFEQILDILVYQKET